MIGSRSAQVANGQPGRHSCAFALVFYLLVSPAIVAQSRADSSASTSFFNSDWLDEYAKELSREPYQSADMAANNPLRQLDYDDYRRIVFKPEAALWRGLDAPFQLQLFHPGFLANSLVRLNLVTASQAQKINFTPAVFNYPKAIDEVYADAVGGMPGFEFIIINTHSDLKSFWFFWVPVTFAGLEKISSTDCRPRSGS